MDEITPKSFDGDLMYEDDKDWFDAEMTVDEADSNGPHTAAAGSAVRAGPSTAGLGSSKRMPIQREEVVRLILQGLRDIGYELVHRSDSSLSAR